MDYALITLAINIAGFVFLAGMQIQRSKSMEKRLEKLEGRVEHFYRNGVQAKLEGLQTDMGWVKKMLEMMGRE